jgi:hypothetical protein
VRAAVSFAARPSLGSLATAALLLIVYGAVMRDRGLADFRSETRL